MLVILNPPQREKNPCPPMAHGHVPLAGGSGLPEQRDATWNVASFAEPALSEVERDQHDTLAMLYDSYTITALCSDTLSATLCPDQGTSSCDGALV